MMILGSFVSPYIDPIFHQIGEKVLTYEPLVPTFAKLFSYQNKKRGRKNAYKTHKNAVFLWQNVRIVYNV